MHASKTDMLIYAVPRLMTIFDFVDLMSRPIAGISKASTWREYIFAFLSLMFFFRWMLLMIASHFAFLREAMQISPSMSLFWAHLCAATCATAPAPTMSTLGLPNRSICHERLLRYSE